MATAKVACELPSGSELDHESSVTPECEVLYEHGPSAQNLYKFCKKNPGHRQFISVSGLEMEHLLPQSMTNGLMELILNLCNTTVKVIVNYTSPHRPHTWPNSKDEYPYSSLGGKKYPRTGTGRIRCNFKQEEPCPCQLCKKSEKPVQGYYGIIVSTSRHVVFDKLEVANTICECFYDSGDKKDVQRIYGSPLSMYFNNSEIQNDSWNITCVTHDRNLVERLMTSNGGSFNFDQPYKKNDVENAFMISHPHGLSKKISFGRIIQIKMFFNQSDDLQKCPLCSSIHHSMSNITSKECNHYIPLRIRERLQCPQLEKEERNVSVRKREVLSLKDLQDRRFFMEATTEYQLLVPCTFLVTSMIPSPNCNSYLSSRGPWRPFPKNSSVTYLDGTPLHFPEDIEFYVDEKCDEPFKVQLVYDIPSCPGSSGAKIYSTQHWGDVIHSEPFHCGTIKHNNANISAKVDGWIQ